MGYDQPGGRARGRDHRALPARNCGWSLSLYCWQILWEVVTGHPLRGTLFQHCGMESRITTIARYTLLEALRTRLPLLVLAAVLVLLAASFFVESISVTEGARIQAGFYAASVRLACVF